MRNIEISMLLRRQSGGSAQLRTLEGTSVHILHHQIVVRGAFKMIDGVKNIYNI